MHEQYDQGRGMDMPSMLVGFACGVLGTLLFATYKQREFERIMNKTRELNERGTEALMDMGTKAQATMENAKTAGTRIVQTAEQKAHDALAAIDDRVSAGSETIQKKLKSADTSADMPGIG